MHLPRNNQLIFVSSVFIVAVALITIAQFTVEHDEAVSPIVGDWNLTTAYGYDTKGEYIKDSSQVCYFGKPITKEDMTLKVSECTNELFRANFIGDNICGEFSRDEIYFEFDRAEYHIVFIGYKSGDILNASFLCFFSDKGSIRGTAYALHCQYLKAGGVLPHNSAKHGSLSFDDYANVKMKLARATVSYGADGYQDLAAVDSNQTLEILKVSGMAFSGRMDQVIADMTLNKDFIKDVRLAGIISEVYDNNMFCSIMDDTGKYWVMGIYGKSISLRCVDVCDTAESWGQPCAISRNYYIGDEPKVYLPRQRDLSNTTWESVGGYMTQTNEFNLDMTMSMRIQFINQRNDTIHFKMSIEDMYCVDGVAMILQFGNIHEVDVYFFDSLGREYTAYISLDEKDKNVIYMTATYMNRDNIGGAFTVEFHKV